jgi:hypothetical protein
MFTLPMIDTPGWIYFLPFWPFGFFGIWVFWNAMRENRDAKSIERSLGWPETQGRVVGGSVVWGHVEVRYEYKAGGQWREGTYTEGLPPQAPSGSGGALAARRVKYAAERYLAKYPVAANVIVRYNPENPEESVLYCKGEVHPPGDGPKVEPHFPISESKKNFWN